MTAKELFDILSNEKITKFGGTVTIQFNDVSLTKDSKGEVKVTETEACRQHSWVHPGTSRHPTHCVKCGQKWEPLSAV